MNFNFTEKQFVPVCDIDTTSKRERIQTNFVKLDNFLSGGLVPGTVFTLTGTPGCGKTTFLLQLCKYVANKGYKAAYASGEEGIQTLAYTCKRVNVENISISNETSIDALVKCTEYVDILIVDSFASITSDIKNARKHEAYCITELCKAAKKNNCVVGVILHISKAGMYKGNTVIPHSVDMTIQLNSESQDDQGFREVVATVGKNRFGRCCVERFYLGEEGFGMDVDFHEFGVDLDKMSKSENHHLLMRYERLLEYTTMTYSHAGSEFGDYFKGMSVLNEMVKDGLFIKSGDNIFTNRKVVA